MTDWTGELTALLGPSEFPPEEADDAILNENEAELGLSFPNDFVEFARRYGTGEFCTGGVPFQCWVGGVALSIG